MAVTHWVGLVPAPGAAMLGCTLVLTCSFLIAQEPEDPARLLDLAATAEPNQALRHLIKVVNALGSEKALPEARRRELCKRLARVMEEKIRRPEDIQAVLGIKATKQVSRQVFYRRYLEYWVYEAPVELCVTLDCPKGRDPVIRAVQTSPQDAP